MNIQQKECVIFQEITARMKTIKCVFQEKTEPTSHVTTNQVTRNQVNC